MTIPTPETEDPIQGLQSISKENRTLGHEAIIKDITEKKT